MIDRILNPHYIILKKKHIHNAQSITVSQGIMQRYAEMSLSYHLKMCGCNEEEDAEVSFLVFSRSLAAIVAPCLPFLSFSTSEHPHASR